jgi:hypothetical protein
MLMTAPAAELTTLELIALIAEAATELQERAGTGNDARPARDALTALSPVVSRRCNLCNASILLALTEKNGHWIPLDETNGNYVLVNGKARWVDGGGTHAFHYDNCPGAIQNQPQEPARSLFDELTTELRLKAPSISPSEAGGEAKADV